MKKFFEEAEIYVNAFEVEDITTSTPELGENETEEGGDL